MRIAEVNIENVRGTKALRMRLHRAKAPATAPGGPKIGEWVVVAGPNGSGKTTLLRAIAAACVGPEVLPRMQVEAWDWISIGSSTAHVTLRVEDYADDDVPEGDRPPGEDNVAGASFGLTWTDDNLKMSLPRRRNHAFVYSRLWASQPGVTGTGWMVVGLGASRTRAPANSLADEMSRGPVRRASVVSLFRADATLRLSLDWVQKTTLSPGVESGETQDAVAVLERVIEPLLASLGALVFDEPTEAKVDSKGIWLKRRGSWVGIADVGMGAESLCASVCEILHRMYQFFGADFLHDTGHRVAVPASWKSGPQIMRSGVVLIDEAENHLHPALQQRLGPWLRLRFPYVQFIVTTHSPYIAQAADSLFVLAKDGSLAELVGEDLRDVVNGSVDDAVTSRLFGLATPYSPRGLELREKLGDIESQMQKEPATSALLQERRSLLDQLPHPVDHEVAVALARLSGAK